MNTKYDFIDHVTDAYSQKTYQYCVSMSEFTREKSCCKIRDDQPSKLTQFSLTGCYYYG